MSLSLSINLHLSLELRNTLHVFSTISLYHLVHRKMYLVLLLSVALCITIQPEIL